MFQRYNVFRWAQRVILTVLALIKQQKFLTGLTYKQLGFWTNDNAVRQLVLSYSALNPGILLFALSMAFGKLFAVFQLYLILRE
jgi:hypothetical protein